MGKKQFPKSENNNTKISSNMAGDSKLDKQTSILSDHSYFLTRPEHLETEIESHQAKSQIKGIMTPSTNLVDKRKIAQAVQSLMKNRNEPVNTSTNIKFKFRMKFKSTMAAANTLKKAQLPRNSHYHHKYPKASSNPIVSTSSSMSSIHDDDFSQMRERRKSASKNAFCPPPGSSSTSSSSSSTASNLNNSHNNKTSPVKNNKHKFNNSSSISPPSAGSSLLARNKNDSEKCREIRDLHNSMERQRRVEQRNHLAYLKKQVPEVADVEKASKLTILRKAMDYCHLLSKMDSRIRKDRDTEQARNERLKKTLLDLTKKHDARRVTTSGRLTGWSQRW